MPEQTRKPIPASVGVMLLFLGIVFVVGTFLHSGFLLHQASPSEQCWELEEPVGEKPDMGNSVESVDWLYLPAVGLVCGWTSADGAVITEFHPNGPLTAGWYFGLIAGLSGCVIIWRRS